MIENNNDLKKTKIVSFVLFFACVALTIVIACNTMNTMKKEKIMEAIDKNNPLAKWAYKAREDANAIFLDYSRALPDNFDTILGVQTFAKLESIQKSKKDILGVLDGLPTFQKRCEEFFVTVEKDIELMDVDDDFKTKALNGFNRSKDSKLADFQEFFTIQHSMLQVVFGTLTMMEDRFGHYKVTDDNRVLFDQDADLEKYNALITSYLHYISSEEEWNKKMNAKERDGFEKIDELLRE